MFTKIRTNEKGFTLIELLIVVAIIGILAAIAIPQFSAYRVRGFNSAASSDLRNIKIQEEAFRTDWQVYASTVACTAATGAGCTGAAGTGAVVVGPGTVNMVIAATAANGTLPTAATSMSFGLSNGVSTAISTTAATANEFVILTAHSSGDVIYGGDSEFTTVKQAGKTVTGTVTTLALKAAGGALAAGIASTGANADDIAGAGWVNM